MKTEPMEQTEGWLLQDNETKKPVRYDGGNIAIFKTKELAQKYGSVLKSENNKFKEVELVIRDCTVIRWDKKDWIVD